MGFKVPRRKLARRLQSLVLSPGYCCARFQGPSVSCKGKGLDMELRSFLGILVFSMYDLCYSSVGRASWALGIRFGSRSAIQWDILGFRLHWVWVGRPCEAPGNLPTPSLVIMEFRIYFQLLFHGSELEAPGKGSIEGIVDAPTHTHQPLNPPTDPPPTIVHRDKVHLVLVDEAADRGHSPQSAAGGGH